jgi:lysozyme family protein
MADFAAAVEYVLANEGGYVNDPADPGGETNFGISKRQYPLLDIRNLTRPEAVDIYQRDYWKPEFAELASQRIATKVFDAYVNSPQAAIRLLQRSLREIQAGPVVVDGVFGADTLAHANACDEGRLIDELKAQLAHFYCDDVINRAAAYRDLLGWLRRAVKG